MTPDHSEHDRERGRADRGDGALDEPRQPGIDWSRVVATIFALIVLAIVTILLSMSG